MTDNTSQIQANINVETHCYASLQGKNDWVETTLVEVCEIKGGKRLPKGENLVPYKTNHPYIRITDLDNPKSKIPVEQTIFEESIFEHKTEDKFAICATTKLPPIWAVLKERPYDNYILAKVKHTKKRISFQKYMSLGLAETTDNLYLFFNTYKNLEPILKEKDGYLYFMINGELTVINIQGEEPEIVIKQENMGEEMGDFVVA